MTLRLPTRIQNDTIWIREDTRTHKAGELVNVKQAAVLKTLGVAPVESLIKIHYAWSDGEIFSEDILYMDTDKFKRDVASAYFTAQKLALELGIVDKDTIEPLTQKAQREALALIYELPIYIEEMRGDYIRKAVLNANKINTVIFGGDTQVSTTKKKTKTEEKEEEEKKDESVGIGNLF
jgi:hypothetical protein